MNIFQETKKSQRSELGLGSILISGAWFGLITGLVEGAGLSMVRQLADYNWNEGLIDVGPECLWASPLVNTALFCMLALLLWPIARMFSTQVAFSVIVFVFSFLMLVDWLGIAFGRWLAPYALSLLAAGLVTCGVRVLLRRHKAAIAFWRRSLLYIAGAVALVLGVTQVTLWWSERSKTVRLAPKEGTPNVLVIVTDTLRADRLSCYGYARQTSPNIDRIAEEGILFTAAFSTSSWTVPSHASMLTGLYSSEHGADFQSSRALLHLDVPVLPEVMLDHGYRTGAFSANVLWFTRSHGFGRGFIRFEDYNHSAWDMVLRTVYGRAFTRYVLRRLGFENILARKRASDINDALLAWIDHYPDRPFFAFINYMDTHDPYLPPEPFRSRFSKSQEVGGIINSLIGRDLPQLTPQQLQSESDAYDGAVSYMDEQVGRLLRELDARGLKDRTLIIFTSDHGESFGEHGLLMHCHSLYRETIHVPLVLYMPDCVPAGVRVDQVVSNAAIPATILDVIGSSTKNPFPGPSLVRQTDGHVSPAAASEEVGPFVMTEVSRQSWANEAWPACHGSMLSILTRTYQWIHHEVRGEELYAWRQDLSERNNLINSQTLQPVLEMMREAGKRLEKNAE